MKYTTIFVHYIYSDLAVEARLPYAEKKHRVETVYWNREGWETAITESYMKLLHADYCWLADANDIPFWVVKNRDWPTSS